MHIETCTDVCGCKSVLFRHVQAYSLCVSGRNLCTSVFCHSWCYATAQEEGGDFLGMHFSVQCKTEITTICSSKRELWAIFPSSLQKHGFYCSHLSAYLLRKDTSDFDQSRLFVLHLKVVTYSKGMHQSTKVFPFPFKLTINSVWLTDTVTDML